MEQKQIPIIALGVFSIVMLLAWGNIDKIYALSSVDVTGLSATNKCVDKGTSVYYFVVDGCQGAAVGSTSLTRFAYSDNSVVNTITIKSLRGNLTSGITTVNSGNDGNVGSIRCQGNFCWVGRTGSGQYQLQKWNIVTGLPVNYANFSVASVNRLETRGLVIGQNEIWSSVQCPTDATRYQPTAWSTSDGTASGLTQTKQINGGNCATSSDIITGSGSVHVNLCYDCGGTANKMRVVYTASQAAGVNMFHVFDGTALVRKCASNLGGAIATTNVRGAAAYLGSSIDKWAVATDSNTVLIVNNNDACTTNTTITSAELGSPANYIKEIGVNVHNGEWMVYHSSTTTAKASVMDLTSLTNLHNLFLTVSGVGSGMESNAFFATDSSLLVLRNKIFLTTGGTTGRMWTLDDTGVNPSEEPPTGNQQDGFCGSGTLRDCLGDRSALSGLVPANENITSIATTIGQGIGLINPNDENPRTNGTGLFLMLITGTFFAVALMSTVHTLNMRGYISASVKEIDPIFWLFLVVGTVSVAWYLDWIDDIIFAAMTVGLAGLIAFGVLKHFGRI